MYDVLNARLSCCSAFRIQVVTYKVDGRVVVQEESVSSIQGAPFIGRDDQALVIFVPKHLPFTFSGSGVPEENIPRVVLNPDLVVFWGSQGSLRDAFVQ